ncbi:MAG: hypothetical protein ACKV2Q_09160 [Planctomycetaceae bacterium]
MKVWSNVAAARVVVVVSVLETSLPLAAQVKVGGQTIEDRLLKVSKTLNEQAQIHRAAAEVLRGLQAESQQADAEFVNKRKALVEIKQAFEEEEEQDKSADVLATRELAEVARKKSREARDKVVERLKQQPDYEADYQAATKAHTDNLSHREAAFSRGRQATGGHDGTNQRRGRKSRAFGLGETGIRAGNSASQGRQAGSCETRTNDDSDGAFDSVASQPARGTDAAAANANYGAGIAARNGAGQQKPPQSQSRQCSNCQFWVSVTAEPGERGQLCGVTWGGRRERE